MTDKMIAWQCPSLVGKTDCCVGNNFVTGLCPEGTKFAQ
jgi:hypothetical protein